MIEAVTKSADDTRDLAGAVAGVARRGDVILLSGDLGTGKTTFVQGFARSLGAEGAVTSPTFTLVRSYPGRIPIVHVDIYRLDRTVEVADLGLAELLDEGAVALVEWGEAAVASLASEYLRVSFDLGGDEDGRRLGLMAIGGCWEPRLAALASALEPWRPEAARR